MAESITVLGYQVSGEDVTGFYFIPGSFVLPAGRLKALEKSVVLFTATEVLFSVQNRKIECTNSFILSWRLSKASKEIIYQRKRIVVYVL